MDQTSAYFLPIALGCYQQFCSLIDQKSSYLSLIYFPQ